MGLYSTLQEIDRERKAGEQIEIPALIQWAEDEKVFISPGFDVHTMERCWDVQHCGRHMIYRGPSIAGALARAALGIGGRRIDAAGGFVDAEA